MAAAQNAPPPARRRRRVHTPTILQMEAVECGAAALAMVLGYFGRIVNLEQLRIDCGVSRDGTKATNILKAARAHGLNGKGFKKEPADLRTMPLPLIVFWNFNHFLVVDGFSDKEVFLNDPAAGPTRLSHAEFDESFTGVVLVFEPGPDFRRAGRKPSLLAALARRLRGSRAALGFILLTTLGLVIPGLVVPAFTRIFVDEVLLGGTHDWFKPLLFGMAVTAIVQAALTWLQQNCLVRLEIKLALATTSQFFWHLLHLPMAFFTQRHAGELSPRVSANDNVAALLSQQIATKGLHILIIAFFAAVMFSYDVVLTFVGIFIAALNLIVLQLVARQRVDGNRKLLKDAEKVMGTAMSGIQQIETIKASGAEADFFARWAGYHAKLLNSEQRLGVLSLLLMSAPVLLGGVNDIAVLMVGGLRVMQGHLTIGMLVAFQGLMHNFLNPVTELLQVAGTVQEVEGDMSRLDDVLKFERLPAPSALPERNGETPPLKLVGEIELRDLTFGYNRCDAPLIENFSLRMKAGSRVALVGGSGSGKSTVSRLVTGLYEAWSGEILLDGVPRSHLPPGTIANSLALVDQDIVLFAGTIRENLTLWDSTIPETSVVQAARDACIHEVIMARPQGYESEVEEGGGNFSGGQRQRLEIARALAGNPSILVLDEGTSALDPTTEQIIDHNLRRRGCTCLIVAHRLSTIRDADEIIVMERGVVTQRGTHDEMILADGPYAQLIAEGISAEPAEAAPADA